MPKNFLRRMLTRPFRSRKPSPIQRPSRTVGRNIEALEDRTTPSISLSFVAGVATFTSNAADDTLQVQATAVSNNILYNSGGIGLASLTGVNQLIFDGNAGKDFLILQSPPGTHFAPSAGIQFNGGGQATDELDMIGGDASWTSTYNPTAVQDGTLSFNNGVLGRVDVV